MKRASALDLKRSQEWALIAVGCLAVTCAFFRPIRHANDIWWHLADGRQILQSHRIPHADIFSSTVHGRAWTDHEWLYDVGVFKLFKLCGPNALIGLEIALIIIALAAVWVRLRRRSVTPSLCFATCFAIAFAGRYAWNPRPDLVSFAGTSLLVLFLEEWSSSVDRQFALCALMALGFAVWANLHAGFIVGLLLLICWAVEKRLWNVAWAGLVATAVNPYGARLYIEIVKVMSRVKTQGQGDWMRTPWVPLQAFWIAMAIFWCALLADVLRNKRFRASVWLSGSALSYLAIAHVRNVPYFLFVCFPTAIELCHSRVKAHFAPGKYQRWLPMAFTAMIAVGLTVISQTFSQVKGGVDANLFPIEACDFIERGNLPGIFYNDFLFGSYWIWRLGPQRPVFIDGRFEMVDGYSELHRDLSRAKSGTPLEWNRFLNLYHVDGALVQFPNPRPLGPIFRAYFPRDQWALVYWDDVALIFVRRNAEAATAIRRIEYATVDPEADPREVTRRWAESFGYRQAWLADVQRNALQHPASARVRQWLILAEQQSSHPSKPISLRRE